jgi:hypothetical protein
MNSKDKKPIKRDSDVSDLVKPLVDVLVEVVELLIKCLEKVLAHFLKKFIDKITGKKSIDRTPIEHSMLGSRKTTKVINAFGYSTSKKTVFSFDELSLGSHTIMTGRTGMGKSYAIMNIIDHSHTLDCPVLFFDPKGNLSAINEFKYMAEYFKKSPIIFSETRLGNATFNPFKKLNNSQRANLIETAFEWSDGEARYYKDRTISIILREVFPAIERNGLKISIPEIYRYMVKDFNDKETAGFLAQLEYIIGSPFSSLLEDLDDTAICMQDIIESNSCAYFGLSVQGYGETAKTIGKIFLGEAQIVSHNLGLLRKTSESSFKKPINLIIDEAGAILFANFINLLNKGRSSGFQILLSVQTLSDLEQIDPIFKKQVLANCGNLIIFHQPLNEDAQEMADSIGTFDSMAVTNVTEDGDKTNMGTIKADKSYIVHPQHIKDLKLGQCIICTRNNHSVNLVNVKDIYTLPSILYMKSCIDSDSNINTPKLSSKNSDTRSEKLLIDKYSTEHTMVRPIRNKKLGSGEINDNCI